MMTTEEMILDEADMRDEWARILDRRTVTLYFELDTEMTVECVFDGFGAVIIESAMWSSGETVSPCDFERLNLAQRILNECEENCEN